MSRCWESTLSQQLHVTLRPKTCFGHVRHAKTHSLSKLFCLLSAKGLLWLKRICTHWEKFFLFRIDPLEKGLRVQVVLKRFSLSAAKSIKCPVPSLRKNSDKNSEMFYITAQNIDCGYSLEPPRRGGSNEYPQSMFLNKNKKNNIMYTRLNPVLLYKCGVYGVKIM